METSQEVKIAYQNRRGIGGRLSGIAYLIKRARTAYQARPEYKKPRKQWYQKKERSPFSGTLFWYAVLVHLCATTRKQWYQEKRQGLLCESDISFPVNVHVLNTQFHFTCNIDLMYLCNTHAVNALLHGALQRRQLLLHYRNSWPGFRRRCPHLYEQLFQGPRQRHCISSFSSFSSASPRRS